MGCGSSLHARGAVSAGKGENDELLASVDPSKLKMLCKEFQAHDEDQRLGKHSFPSARRESAHPVSDTAV